jgi:hypothetical protein
MKKNESTDSSALRITLKRKLVGPCNTTVCKYVAIRKVFLSWDPV